MNDIIQITGVPVITAIVFAALMLLKSAVPSPAFAKFLPLLAAATGVALGIIAFYAAPETMPANNILTAILVGGASGLAATGTHQIFKQIKSCPCDKETEQEINKTED